MHHSELYCLLAGADATTQSKWPDFRLLLYFPLRERFTSSLYGVLLDCRLRIHWAAWTLYNYIYYEALSSTDYFPLYRT